MKSEATIISQMFDGRCGRVITAAASWFSLLELKESVAI
jgi:hypothetical protein